MPPYLYEIRGRISLLLFLRLLRFRVLKAVSAIAHPPVFCLRKGGLVGPSGGGDGERMAAFWREI